MTGNYWDFPTESDTVPTSEPPPGTDMTNGSANYYSSGHVIGSPYYRTEVGAYDAKPSDSPYGTFDQGGNVYEWNEAVLFDSDRGLRGGSFEYPDDYGLHATERVGYPPTDEYYILGFRVVKVLERDSVPTLSEWGAVIMTLLTLVAGTLVFTRRSTATL